MECPHVPEIDYGDFSKTIHDKVIAKHIPLAFALELTYRCNLRCLHCYVDHSDIRNELSYSEISNIFDQAVAEGALWLLLTGGEPFVRKDFLDIYLDAKKKGLLVTLFTNGTLINSEIADFLAEWRPFSIEISLYGATKEVYETVTGIPGSYDKCMKAIDLLLERRLPLKLKSMVLTINRQELESMKAFAEQRNLSFRFDALINPRLDGSKEPSKVSLTPEEVVELDVSDKERFAAWQEFAEEFNRPPVDSDRVYLCGAGVESFHLDPYGQMSICTLARKPSYDLRNGSFKEGWHRFIPQVRAQKRRYNYPCPTCEKRFLCGQCPGWAQLEHDNQEEPVEYLCRIAHLRAEAFGMDSPENKALNL